MFRPWGLLDWALALSASQKWHFVGCLGTEYRSLAAWRAMKEPELLDAETLLRIRDVHHKPLAEQRIVERLAEFYAAGGKRESLRDFALLDRIYELLGLADVICGTSPHVVLDITSLPKRFFFILLKRLLLAGHVRNLIVTYTLPAGYETHEPLCEDPEPWGNLPTFLGADATTAQERLIVNVGFMPDGLQEHLSSLTAEQKVSLFIPFPAPIAAVRRSWEAVYRLENGRQLDVFDEYRVDAKDMSEAFERILTLTERGAHPATFAPFGPKTISAAMCIFASLTDSPVFYAQPKAYHPDYTTGVAVIDGKPQIYAYWIKHDAEILYRRPG